MEVHINHWLLTKGRVPNACVGGFGDQAILLGGPQYWEPTIHVRGMCKLALVALARVGKQSN